MMMVECFMHYFRLLVATARGLSVDERTRTYWSRELVSMIVNELSVNRERFNFY